jgi:hypothetical protein
VEKPLREWREFFCEIRTIRVIRLIHVPLFAAGQHMPKAPINSKGCKFLPRSHNQEEKFTTVAGIIKITIFGGYEYDLSQVNLAGRHNGADNCLKRL